MEHTPRNEEERTSAASTPTTTCPLCSQLVRRTIYHTYICDKHGEVMPVWIFPLDTTR